MREWTTKNVLIVTTNTDKAMDATLFPLEEMIEMTSKRHCCARNRPHHTHDLCSGSQDHHPSTNLVQKKICCNSTSIAPDDGRMRPKHVQLRIHQ